MSVTVAPGAAFEWVMEFGVTGQEGTVAYKIDTGADVTLVGPVTAGITELGTIGTYVAAIAAAPGTAGQYVLLGSYDGTFDPDTTFSEQLNVTGDAAAVAGTGQLYVSTNEVKAAADLLGETFSDTEIGIVIPAVCQAINLYKKTRYYPTTQTRYYTARQGALSVPIHDANTVTEVAVDDGDYSYDTVWVENTDYFLEPANAPDDGYPYREICLVSSSGRFPSHQRGVRVTGSFGWAETPPVVKLAAEKLAVRELAALKTAPMGLVIASEMAARIGSMYRDIADLLDNLPPRPKTGSIQLG